MSYKTIRAGLKNALSDLHGVQVYDSPAETAVLPAVVVGSFRRDGMATFDPTQTITVDLLLLASRKNVDQYDVLDRMCESTGVMSVQAKLEADGSLGGAVSDLRVVSVEQAGTVEVDGEPQFGAVVTVEVWT